MQCWVLYVLLYFCNKTSFNGNSLVLVIQFSQFSEVCVELMMSVLPFSERSLLSIVSVGTLTLTLNEFQVHKSKLSTVDWKKTNRLQKEKLYGKRKKENFKSYRINDENRCESNENHMRARIRGRQTDREANRQKDTKTDRQIDRHMDGQADKMMRRQTDGQMDRQTKSQKCILFYRINAENFSFPILLYDR